MSLSIGFRRSGSSLIGFFLTAHPSIVYADEATADLKYDPHHDRYFRKMERPIRTLDQLKRPKTRFLYTAELEEIFDYLLCADRLRYLLGTSIFNYRKNQNLSVHGSRMVRYVCIPNQYQGRFQSLQVIGNKHPGQNVDTLSDGEILKDLTSKLQDKKIRLKFIFNVRNPYDMVATLVTERNMTAQIELISNHCENNMKILEQINPDDLFVCKNEDVIENPKQQLRKLCDFLEVAAPVDYINDLASLVITKPTSDRFYTDWSPKDKQKVASLIEKYDFFSGYDW